MWAVAFEGGVSEGWHGITWVGHQQHLHHDAIHPHHTTSMPAVCEVRTVFLSERGIWNFLWNFLILKAWQPTYSKKTTNITCKCLFLIDAFIGIRKIWVWFPFQPMNLIKVSHSLSSGPKYHLLNANPRPRKNHRWIYSTFNCKGWGRGLPSFWASTLYLVYLLWLYTNYFVWFLQPLYNMLFIFLFKPQTSLLKHP